MKGKIKYKYALVDKVLKDTFEGGLCLSKFVSTASLTLKNYNMEFKLTAHVESFGNAGYIAWVDSIKGMVVQAETLEKACEELMVSLKMKIAYDLGLDVENLTAISEVQAKQLHRELIFKEAADKGECKREFNLTLA